MSLIFHVCTQAAWAEAKAAGEYQGSADDLRDGFIHFSAADQLRDSVARHRAGQAGLVILGVEASRLGAALRWESSRGGALFPHLYGPLRLAAVVFVRELPLGEDGVHRFPSLEP